MNFEQNNSMIYKALEYASNGLSVFPLMEQGKTPATKHGCKDASISQDTINTWWNQNRNYNIGIATGIESHIVVIDLDVDEAKNINGCDSLKEWQDVNGVLPSTWTVCTGRGGYHLYFKTDKEYKNRAGILPGIDIRGSGGYVVAPPSKHPNGNYYKWVKDHSPKDMPISDVNEIVEKFLNIGINSSDDNYTTKNSDSFVISGKVPQGQRNDRMFRLACFLQVKGLNDEAIYAACSVENKKNFEPPLTETELRTIISNCLTRYSKGASILEQPKADEKSDNPHFFARIASTYGENKIEYAWYPYLPIGEYTVLMASGGTGKTILCCGIAASITRGEMLPGDLYNHAPANVLFISAEDRGELLKERLSDSGADLDKVYIVDCLNSQGLNFTSRINELQQLITDSNAKLVLIDPWHAFIGAEADVNKINVVRPIFQKVASIAKLCNCSIVLLSHVNKRVQSENYNNSAIGSADLINASRSALTVLFPTEENSDENTRILVHTKSNYSKAGRSIEYHITSHGGVMWNGFSDITRQSLEEAARKRTTVNNVIRKKALSSQLIDALVDIASKNQVKLSSGRPLNISYDEIKALYGEDIFGGMQPKRALDNIADEALDEFNLNIVTGKQVSYRGSNRNGFGLSQNNPSKQEYIQIGGVGEDNPFIETQ